MIEYVLGGSAEGGGSGSAAISEGATQFSLSCTAPSSTPDCFYTVPFSPGRMFEVSLSATASGFCGDTYCSQAGPGVTSLGFFEAEGTTPVDYFPVTVPEPRTGFLLLLAMPLASWRFRQRVCERAE